MKPLVVEIVLPSDCWELRAVKEPTMIILPSPCWATSPSTSAWALISFQSLKCGVGTWAATELLSQFGLCGFTRYCDLRRRSH